MTKQPSPATEAASQSAGPRRIRRWVVASLLGLVILVSVWRLLFFNLWDSDVFVQPPTWDGTPKLVETTFTNFEPPPGASFLDRLSYGYGNFNRKLSGRNPQTYTFPARTNALHSVFGLLKKCMEITGTKYQIAPEAYLIEFGHTNTLVGTQWVATVENVLQTG